MELKFQSEFDTGLQDGLGVSSLRGVLREELKLGMHELLERLVSLMKAPYPGHAEHAPGNSVGNGLLKAPSKVLSDPGPRKAATSLKEVAPESPEIVNTGAQVTMDSHPFSLCAPEKIRNSSPSPRVSTCWTAVSEISPRSVTSDDVHGNEVKKDSDGMKIIPSVVNCKDDLISDVESEQPDERRGSKPVIAGRRLSVSDSTRSKALKRRTTNSLFMKDQGEEHETKLQRFTRSSKYELLSGTLILVNAAFIGWQTQHLAELYRDRARQGDKLGDPPVVFLIVHILFTFVFVAELLPRWIASGLIDFFRSDEMVWNILDVIVVVSGVIESILDVVERAAGEDLSGNVLQNVSTLRLLRIVRVVRVVRVIRIVKFFRELRMMIYSILGSMKNLLWVIIILGVTFYLFGVTFTSAVVENLDKHDWNSTEYAPLLDSFGTVDRSALSLFMSMSGGNDWSMYYDALRVLPIGYCWVFLGFINFTLFAIVNIVTGVFVEAAMQSNLRDRDIIAQEELESKKNYLDSMQELFLEMDGDGEGTIDETEFENKLKDERVIAFFNALKLDVSDARILFRLIDTDKSGDITIDEFVKGVYRLQGESRSLDMKIMQFEVEQIRSMFIELHGSMKDMHRMVSSRPVWPTASHTLG